MPKLFLYPTAKRLLASAWGDSWGSAWGDSWGAIAVVPPAPAASAVGGGAGGLWWSQKKATLKQGVPPKEEKQPELVAVHVVLPRINVRSGVRVKLTRIRCGRGIVVREAQARAGAVASLDRIALAAPSVYAPTASAGTMVQLERIRGDISKKDLMDYWKKRVQIQEEDLLLLLA